MESIWFATRGTTRAEAPHTSGVFEPGSHADTIVAGAGLTGLATAVLLARAGQRVVVLEARYAGAVTTGRTTAKLSLLQGLVLSDIRRFHTDTVLRAYVEGNREGQAWLVRLLDSHGVRYDRRDAYTYATTAEGADAVRAELDACAAGGLSAHWTDTPELPFPVAGAITLPDQVQFDPLDVLDALLTELVEHGGVLVEGVRLTDARSHNPVIVGTSQGEMTADRLVLATGAPVLDRGAYFAKLTPLRSCVTTYRVPGIVPRGMYLSADDPTRSLRTVPRADGEEFMVGGNGHVTGRLPSPADAVADLERWTSRHFPGAERTHAWSAQDYRSVNSVPFVGLLPRGAGAIYLATGYNKWGMTNAVAAALNLSGQILGGSMPWAATLGAAWPWRPRASPTPRTDPTSRPRASTRSTPSAPRPGGAWGEERSLQVFHKPLMLGTSEGEPHRTASGSRTRSACATHLAWKLVIGERSMTNRSPRRWIHRGRRPRHLHEARTTTDAAS